MPDSRRVFDAASGCYLTPQDAPTSLVNSNLASGNPKGTKFYRCWVILSVVDGRPEGIERFESVIRPPGEPERIDPRVAAQRVVETMNFVAPQLGLSPYVQSATHEGVVNAPIWMWVTDPGSTTTGPQTKRAAIGGVAIEATGTVDRIEWSMGAGDLVTCKGPGTRLTQADAEGKSLKQIPASPTCGHKYRKTSRCEKSGVHRHLLLERPLDRRRHGRRHPPQLQPLDFSPDDRPPPGPGRSIRRPSHHPTPGTHLLKLIASSNEAPNPTTRPDRQAPGQQAPTSGRARRAGRPLTGSAEREPTSAVAPTQLYPQPSLPGLRCLTAAVHRRWAVRRQCSCSAPLNFSAFCPVDLRASGVAVGALVVPGGTTALRAACCAEPR